MNGYIGLFGKESIDCLLADREFIGDHWLGYLNANGIQIIVSFNKPEQAQSVYKERWQIETAFKALKSSGFNIEDTHLTEMERISKLFALGFVAFLGAYKAGIYVNEICPIKIKSHGRKAMSLFKYGLTFLDNVLFGNNLDSFKVY